MILYLFDLDGTLLRAHRAGSRAFDAVFAAELGIADASAGIRFGGRTDLSVVDEVVARHRGRPATVAERAQFLAAYPAALRAELAATGVERIAGVVEALAWLAARADVVLGVATGNVRDGADAKLAHAGLADYFALGGYGCDAVERAGLVAAAIARARARHPIAEVVVVGDTVHDIAAARACGAVAVAVATGADPADALAGADVVLADLRALPAWHAARFAGATARSGAPTAPPDR